jgi:hypothetical protein
MPETEAQINGLRAAFSADVNRPFELKSSFPLGSPSESYHPSPPAQSDLYQQPQVVVPSSQSYMKQQQQMNQLQQGSYLATPPVSAVSDSKPQSPLNPHAYDMNAQSTAGFTTLPTNQFYQQTLSPHDGPQWNPTPIIDQFAIPQSALAPSGAYGSSPPIQMPAAQPPYLQHTPSPPYPAATTYPPSQNHQAYYAEMQQRQQQTHEQQQQRFIDSQQHHLAQHQHQQHQVPPYPPPENVQYVTPKQWQQSVASVYDPGLKRRWSYMQSGGGGGGPQTVPGDAMAHNNKGR